MSDQNINIKLDRGGPENHAWTVLGTLLACGAVGMPPGRSPTPEPWTWLRPACFSSSCSSSR